MWGVALELESMESVLPVVKPNKLVIQSIKRSVIFYRVRRRAYMGVLVAENGHKDVCFCLSCSDGDMQTTTQVSSPPVSMKGSWWAHGI